MLRYGAMLMLMLCHYAASYAAPWLLQPWRGMPRRYAFMLFRDERVMQRAIFVAAAAAMPLPLFSLYFLLPGDAITSE